MKKQKLVSVLFVLSIFWSLTACNQLGNQDYSIIPEPFKIIPSDGFFHFNENTVIRFDNENDEIGLLATGLQNRLEATGLSLETGLLSLGHPDNELTLRLDDKTYQDTGEEGYNLLIEENHILLKAARPAGIFYGLQTLYQLMPPGIYVGQEINEEETIKVPCAQIFDKPRFSWRGMHLDVSRHFFPKEFIFRYIDLIALHKMNVFHWHLTDDNGWRIEIKKYPGLTEVRPGGLTVKIMPWREVTPPEPGEKATYGGFYTQEDIEEIVEYAKRTDNSSSRN